MTRSAFDNVETEGDFALGMGIAIGMFIALFAVCIALFVIEQGKAHSGPQSRATARGTTAVAMPVDAPAGTTPAHAAQ
ncbi:MAG TPA: hypothetical protein VEN28_13345 [Burkholderiaceae bacterium]|nr:hypothetical protein [Burkholderiaceae bacterium]